MMLMANGSPVADAPGPQGQDFACLSKTKKRSLRINRTFPIT
jgi:hypothetical protein